MPQVSPIALTDDETTRLLKSFLRGRHEVLEDDCVALVNWARESRARVFILDMMIAGDVQPVIENGEVKVALPQTTHSGAREVS